MQWKRVASLCAFSAAMAGIHPIQAYAVTDDDLNQIRLSIQQLEQRHEEDARHIKELERKLQAYQAASETKTMVAAAVPAAVVAAPPQQTAVVEAASAPPAAPASAGSFNPAIGVVLMGTYANYGRNPDNAPLSGFNLGSDAKSLGPRGFSIGESEVTMSANIDPSLYGQLILSVPREGGVDVEEGFIQTTSLPGGFTAKAGRFFSGIGYLNEQHQHAWDFLDAPLPYRAMLNNQLGDEGVQLRWLAPTETFLQFGVEGLRGDKFPATPTNNGAGAQSVFVKAGGDVDDSNSWLASAAYYHADAKGLVTDNDTFTGSTNMGIGGLVWKWAPDGNPVETNLKLQGEYFFQRRSGIFNGFDYAGNQNGFYGQAVYRFMQGWTIGTRYDQVSSDGVSNALAGSTLDPMGRTPHRYSAALTYDTSEFGRFRLQYNDDHSAPWVNHNVLLNYAVSLGAHGAHQY